MLSVATVDDYSEGEHKGFSGACDSGRGPSFPFPFSRLLEPTEGRIKDFVCLRPLI